MVGDNRMMSQTRPALTTTQIKRLEYLTCMKWRILSPAPSTARWASSAALRCCRKPPRLAMRPLRQIEDPDHPGGYCGYYGNKPESSGCAWDAKGRRKWPGSGLQWKESRGVAQPGSAPALGAGGRRFKSSRPDQINPTTYRWSARLNTPKNRRLTVTASVTQLLIHSNVDRWSHRRPYHRIACGGGQPA